MQPKKFSPARSLASIVLIVASGASYAATESFNVTVTTLPDVVLSQKQALSFGANMFVTAGGTCLMNATVPGEGTLMQYQDTGSAAAASFGALTGLGCVNGTATPGVYKIKGLGSTNVTITIDGVVGADFNFSPNSGCIVNFDNSAAAADSQDSCDAFVPGTPKTTKLPAATATEEGSGAPGYVVEGELVFSVGGTVTIGGTDLTPNTAYTESFPVNVVY